MENTPASERIHIGIFGRCNSGKSSLVNALSGQQAAIVSQIAGTTTDPVRKSMELPGLGAVLLTDTPGYDDAGELGAERLTQMRRTAERSDIALVVCDGAATPEDRAWIDTFRNRGIPLVVALNKCDALADPTTTAALIEAQTRIGPIPISTHTGEGIDTLIAALAVAGNHLSGDRTITGDLAPSGQVVLLVMPQDAQAPKGRLILPQAQTLRELLDKGCIAVSCAPNELAHAFGMLTAPPALVVTDSQVFAQVERLIPADVPLTSFSVLFAHYKGDAALFVEGAAEIDRLSATSRVLIAEACSHAPAGEDIGRVKIPRLLRDRAGEGLAVEVVSGEDFPADLTPYNLVIHCGACMFNRRLVLARTAQAQAQGIPITNYGIALAHLGGILPRVTWPSRETEL